MNANLFVASPGLPRGRRVRAGLGAALFLAVMGLIVSPVSGQPAADKPAEKVADKPATPTGPAPVEIDIESLLEAPEVLAAQAFDAIWTIEPQPGRRLVQIPLKVTPGKAPFQLDRNTVRIKGGQLIAFRLDEPPEVKNKKTSEPIQPIAKDAVPMMAQEVVIKPDETMHWEMERAFKTGAKVREADTLYAYKLNSELLNRQNPGPPPRVDSRSDPRGAQATIAEYQAKSRYYQELRKRVLAADDEFDAPLPARVWAVMDIHFSIKELQFEGQPPLNWVVPIETLEAARKVGGRVEGVRDTVGRVHFTSEIDQLLAKLSALVTDKHPYSARLAAFVLFRGQLVSQATLGTPLYGLVDQVLRSTDPTARQVVLKELVLTLPPTAATASLVKVAAANMAGGERVITLQAMMANIGDLLNPGAGQEAIGEANRMLSDPTGPPVADTLKALMKTAEEKPESVPLLVNGVRFESMPDQRRDAALIAVVENAATDKLAAAWVDSRLLGSVDPRIVRRTLEIIASADSSDQWVASMMDAGLTRMFGPGKTESKGVGQRVQLGGAIPIASGNHSLFRALQHGDTEIRSLAWESLPRFALPGPRRQAPMQPGNPGILPPPVDEATSPYDVLVDVALGQSPTPPRVVEFVQRQHDTGLVVRGLVRLVLRGSERASLQATRALLKPRQEWPVDRAIMGLSPGDRHSFAIRTYENVRGRAPLLAVLMRLRVEPQPGRLTLPEWFGAELANGALPSEAAWAERAGGEEYLLGLITSSDPDVALGAVSALVWAAGGDDRLVRALTEKFRVLPDQSAASIKKEWVAAKRDIYAVRLQRAAGLYRLTLRVGGAAGVSQDHHLGTLQLQADGQNVKVADQTLTLSVPDTRMAIRVEKPAELKGLKADQAAQVPLERVVQPIDLLPQADGSWRGSFALPDQAAAELLLQPATGS